MAYPVEIFPASDLTSHLEAHTTRVTKTSNAGTTIRIRKDPITSDRLRNDCELLRMFQYECKILEGGYDIHSAIERQKALGGGKKKGWVGDGDPEAVRVKCFPVERLLWRCDGNLMIDGTASEIAHRQAAESSRESSNDRRS